MLYSQNVNSYMNFSISRSKDQFPLQIYRYFKTNNMLCSGAVEKVPKFTVDEILHIVALRTVHILYVYVYISIYIDWCAQVCSARMENLLVTAILIICPVELLHKYIRLTIKHFPQQLFPKKLIN